MHAVWAEDHPPRQLLKHQALLLKQDLGMACHTLPLKKAKKQGEMLLPSLGLIPLIKCRIQG